MDFSITDFHGISGMLHQNITYSGILLPVFQVIKAVNQTFSFEEDLQEIDEAQESFMKFFEEKLRYVI